MGSSEIQKPGLVIAIEFLTLAQRRRRDDWAIARASFTSATGTYGGHTIHDYADHGRLSVQAARGSILNPETKDQILAKYHELAVRDRYYEERDAYGIWQVNTCSDRPDPVKHYLIHRVNAIDLPDVVAGCGSRYDRIAAPTIAEALALAERGDSPGYYSYGIMAADYAEARAAGIQFFDGDGLLL